MRDWITEDRWAPGNAELYAVAVTLEHYYTGSESIFERIAREFEGLPPGGDRWHKDLLHAMATSVPGFRPALISDKTMGALARLLAFRHFMRHAYAVDLDPDQLKPLAHRLLLLHADLSSELERFIAQLMAPSTT